MGGGERRLVTYGTLAPGRANHHQLDGLSGRWFRGRVRGTLVDGGWGSALGYPAIVLDADGPEVEVDVFESADLPGQCARLDDFEGDGYARVVTTVSTGSGPVEASIYALRPAVPPDVRVVTGTEREVLEGFLELYRGVVPAKLAGLGEAEARRELVPSRTTVLGLVKHLTAVEREWFGTVLGRQAVARPADDGWGVGDDTVAGVLAGYARACAESRAVAARHELDETVPHPGFGAVSLRWIYVHMIEESARHAGHLDILREQTDGKTGFD